GNGALAAGLGAQSDDEEVAGIQVARPHVLNEGEELGPGPDRGPVDHVHESERAELQAVAKAEAVPAILEVGDGVGAAAGSEDEDVGTLAAGQRVVALAAAEPVGALAAVEVVHAGTAVQ